MLETFPSFVGWQENRDADWFWWLARLGVMNGD